MSELKRNARPVSDRMFALANINLMAKRFQFFDILLFVYIAAFVREYFWIIPNNSLAWVLTVAVSLLLSGFYLKAKQPETEDGSPSFWLIAGLPLFLIYMLRAGYPDLSFDVLNYHIFHSERALRGLIHIPGDFAPAYFPFFNNPVADIITGVSRHLLGFRLGTIVNFLALLWTGQILFKFVGNEISNKNWRAVAVLLVLLSEQLLFEINNYMVDLLALPLLLEATYRVVNGDVEEGGDTSRFVIVAALLGASVALKLTNLVFVVPIGLVLLVRFGLRNSEALYRALRTLPAMATAFVAPILPHALYLYRTTGNPVFPLYNKLFQSPYWVNENPFDGRWGPVGATEILIWPFKILLRHDRLTELNAYSGRITIGVAAAFFLLLIFRQRRAWMIALITIVAAFLWSLVTGYIRYGLFLEILCGLCLILLGTQTFRSISQSNLRIGLAVFVFAALTAQAVLALVYIHNIEWGGRGIGFEHPREYRSELAQLLRDHSFKRYLSRDQLSLFQDVGVWVESSYKTSALAVVLRPDVPYVNLFNEAFVATPAAIQKFREAVKAVEGRKMMSVIFQDDLQMAVMRLNKRGFAVTKTTEVQLPYYSFQRRLPVAVLEVVPDPAQRRQGIFSAELSLVKGVPTLKTGEESDVVVRVRNTSGGTWLARDAPAGTRRVTLGNKWLDESGRIVINDDGRTSLPEDLAPDGELELKLHIHAPAKPGRYTLVVDLVQEQVAWFFEKGSTPLQAVVTIVH